MNKYTRDVQKVLEVAEKYALNTGGELGTEHLILGFLSVEDCYACEILTRLGITKDKVAMYFNQTFPREIFQINAMVKRVFELSYIIASRYNYDLADTQHLLLAVAYETSSAGAKILKQNKIEYNQLKDIVDSMNYNDIGKQDDTDDILKQFKNFIGQAFQNESGNDDFKTNTQPNTPNSGNNGVDDRLDKFGIDLTEKAKSGKIDPVIGRSKEIERIIQILSRRTKNNPVLIGEPGVGKTAIVEGLALAIVNGDVPEILKGKKIFSLDLNSMVAGSKYRGDFEERLKNALDALKSSNTILFIDEIHTIMRAGDSEGGLNASNILKPMLARGEISTIGATTIDEYRKHIEKDSALERRFQPIVVDPPTVEDTIDILKGLREKYEIHHKVKITDEAISAAAVLSDRYITDRFLPDKAIDLIDEAASKMRVSHLIAPPDVKSLEEKIATIDTSINQAVKMQEYAKAGKLKAERDNLSKELNEIKKKWGSEKIGESLAIGEKEIAIIVSDWTKIPVTNLTEQESDKLLKMEDTLKKRVIGQDEAVISITKAVKRARAGLKDPKRPIGSFIFLGPTGVGKTELSKALAECMFGDENSIIRMDMSEYMEKINVSRLIGSAPGYVGYEDGGQLTEKVRRRPYSVVLFDEIEKAHPDIYNILLQVLEDGRLTDSQGRAIDFKNTIIIMTSNIGATDIAKMPKVGFGESEDTKNSEYEAMKERQMDALKATMRPEFINRIDDIIIFRKLEKSGLRSILDLIISNLQKRLDDRSIKLEFSDSAKDYLLEKGFDKNYGARPLKRTVQKIIEDKLSEEIIKGNLINDSVVNIDCVGDTIEFNIQKT